ncbi:diacylglycerol kinase [Fructilactobacillus florum]|uniref:diacylglycerol kinase n=1 Tax=Fructilactobacillus florum TaxID=640331 RepID=UPI00054F7C32|nr:diacylglycerol kinase [Fructilactobacillus florum]
MQKRARIIFNPTSGRETLKNKLVDILNVLEQGGYETSIYATTPAENSAQNEARRVAQAGFDLVVAAGGDGTINAVINGIAPLEKRPRLGIIPAGTTNDFARALGIPRDDFVEAARVIANGQTTAMDVGKASNQKLTHYFINIAAGGRLTELTYDVPSDLKTVFGYMAYLMKAVEMLPQARPMDIKVQYDGGSYAGKASMFFLAMTNSVGGLEQAVPNASLSDGKFTMIIVKTGNMVEIMQLIMKVMNGGRHVHDSRIIYQETTHFSVKDNQDKMPINLDGEYGGDAPMDFQNLKEHIEIFSNLKAVADPATQA